MLEIAFEALNQLLMPERLAYLVLGVMIGLVVGMVPGLSGAVGLALLLPLVYGMDPISALAMMVGLLAVTQTSDTFATVLLGVPGTASSASTIIDGYPLAKQGQAGRALGAAFTASLLGGLIGALALFLVLPIARPVIVGIGSPELFMLTLFGLSMVSILSPGKSAVKGLIMGFLGLLLSTVGGAPASSEYRFTFGLPYLSGGISLVIVILGLFAIPELIELIRRDRVLASGATKLTAGRLQGMIDVFKHKWLVLRSSIIGVVLGAIPGLGGSAATWIVYGLTKQSYRDNQSFGKGDIRGVIGPESANNSNDGGSMMPTLLLGIPGGAGTAILLGGLIMIGIQPGPRLVEEQPSMILVVVWTLALANVIGTAMCFLLSSHISRLTMVRPGRLVPFIFIAVTFAVYQANQHIGDLFTLAFAGLIGWIMVKANWPRAPFIIGFVLGPLAESYLWISMSRYGVEFLTRPGVIVLGLITVALIWFGIRSGGGRVEQIARSRAKASRTWIDRFRRASK